MDYFLRAPKKDSGKILSDILSDLASKWDGFSTDSHYFREVTLKDLLNSFDYNASPADEKCILLVPEKRAKEDIYVKEMDPYFLNYKQLNSGIWMAPGDISLYGLQHSEKKIDFDLFIYR